MLDKSEASECEDGTDVVVFVLWFLGEGTKVAGEPLKLGEVESTLERERAEAAEHIPKEIEGEDEDELPTQLGNIIKDQLLCATRIIRLWRNEMSDPTRTNKNPHTKMLDYGVSAHYTSFTLAPYIIRLNLEICWHTRQNKTNR